MPDHPPVCLHEDRWVAIKESLTRIEAQTVKTNGRVSLLERWQYLVTGAVIVLGSVFGAKLGALSALQAALGAAAK